jgi:cytochrome c-type biogenesis protein CcmH
MLWLLITLAMIATVALVGWPFLRRTRLADGASADIYRAQLSELEREEAAGLISTEDARMARTEIQRRLIATSGATATLRDSDMTLTDRSTFIAVSVSLAIGSAIIYSVVGSPGVGSSSHPPLTVEAINAMAGGASTGEPGVPISVAPVDEMILNLEQRLAAEPNDAEGWRMLGWSKFRTDDYAGAAAAYGKAAKLAPQDAETLSAYGEALARTSGGMVTPDAEAALRAAVKLDPSDARARFLLGLKKEQQGNPQAALNDWLTMLNGAEPDAPWYEEVRGRVVELSQSSGIDVSARLPTAPAMASVDAQRPAGPTATQVSEAAAMAPEARQAMVDGMVSRLDARLKADPNDLEGWLKLIRARRVLGQTDLAQKAVADGQAAFAKDAAAKAQLQQAMTAPLDLASN